ncbi:MAG: hypothetical protein ACI3Z0_00555 [Candidatus Cryptobacteroides sp.]
MRRLLYIFSLAICALFFIDREGGAVVSSGCESGGILSCTTGISIDSPESCGECIPAGTLSVPGISIASSNGGNSVFRTRKSLQERMAASFTSTSAASLASFRTLFYFHPSGTHSRSRYAKLICVLRL